MNKLLDLQEQYEFAHGLQPAACPACLRNLRDLAPAPREDHTAALRIALKDVLDASLETDAMETVPRKLWLALGRAGDVLADVDHLPF